MNSLPLSQPSINSECVSFHRSTLELPLVCCPDSSLNPDDFLSVLSFDPSSSSVPINSSSSLSDDFFQSPTNTNLSQISSLPTFDQHEPSLNDLFANPESISCNVINSIPPNYTWNNDDCCSSSSPSFSSFPGQDSSHDLMVSSSAVTANTTPATTAPIVVENNFLSSPAIPLMTHQPTPTMVQSLQNVPPLIISAPSPPPVQPPSFLNSSCARAFDQPIHFLPGYSSIDPSLPSFNSDLTLAPMLLGLASGDSVSTFRIASQGQLLSRFSVDNYDDDAFPEPSIYVPHPVGKYMESRKTTVSSVDMSTSIVDPLSLTISTPTPETPSFIPSQPLLLSSTNSQPALLPNTKNESLNGSCSLFCSSSQYSVAEHIIPSESCSTSTPSTSKSKCHKQSHCELDHNGRPPRKFTKRRYRCNHCDATFYHTSIDEYVKHIVAAESEFGRSAIGRIYKCDDPTCPWAHIGFTRKLEKKRHMDRKHKPPSYKCRYWTESGEEAFPEAGKCSSLWHADIGSRRRHETNVHGRPWDETCELKAREHREKKF